MDDYQLFDAEATKVFNSIDSDFSFAILLVPGTVHCPFIKEVDLIYPDMVYDNLSP